MQKIKKPSSAWIEFVALTLIVLAIAFLILSDTGKSANQALPVVVSDSTGKLLNYSAAITEEGDVIAAWESVYNKKHLIKAAYKDVHGDNFSTPVTVFNSGSQTLKPEVITNGSQIGIVFKNNIGGKQTVEFIDLSNTSFDSQ